MSGFFPEGTSRRLYSACGNWRVQFAVCLVIGAVLSVAAGQDANWDLRNYHLATAYSIMTGQFDRDIFPGDFQSALNPTLDFPYVLLAMGSLAHYPRVLAAIMGLWFGALLFITLRIISLLFSSFAEPERLFAILIATTTAVTGVAAFSQVGSTTGDIPVGVLILGGLWCVLASLGTERGNFSNAKLLAGGGILFGLAAGCKLTGAIYAPALCLALLLALSPLIWARACAIFSAGWLVGFLPPFGWWGWMLWSRFGAPTFPLLNNIFHSPLAPPLSLVDVRFFPHDVMQWIFYPFYWALRAQPMIVIEPAIRDPRMAIAYTALAALIIVAAAQRFVKKQIPQFVLTRIQAVTLLFLALSYFAWLISSSIIRYAVPIEVLSIPCAIVAVQALAKRFALRAGRGLAIAFAVIACAVSVVDTLYIDWPRVPYGDKVFGVDMSWTKPNTLFVSVIGPVAYLSAFVAPEAHARFVGFGYVTMGARQWPIGEAIAKTVKTHKGPIEVLFTEDMRYILKQLPLVGLSPDLGPCRTVNSNIDAPLGEPVYACEGKLLAP